VSTATHPAAPAPGHISDPGRAPSPPPRRWGLIAFTALVLVGAGAGAYYLRNHAGASSAEADGGGEGEAATESSAEPLAVAVVRLNKGGITRTSTQIGTVQAFEEADLYAKVSGYLSKLNVDYGSRVKQGQVLAEIDDPEVFKEKERSAAMLVQGEAKVQQAEARIKVAKAFYKAAQATVVQSQAEIERTAATRSYRDKVLQRFTELAASRSVPQQVVDEQEENFKAAVATEKAARSAVLTAEAQAEEAESKIEQAKADLAGARADVKVDEAADAKAGVLVDYTKIISPYDGVVTRREFFRGAFIRSASEGGNVPLMSVAKVDQVRVVTYVPDRDVPLTDIGDEAEITLDALPNQVFKGKVSLMADREDPSSRTMHTEVFLPNADNKFRPGMYGIAKIILNRDVKNSTLPASCLVGEAKEGKGDVFTIKDGKVHRTAIQIGTDDGIRVEVISGIGPDDDVIASTGTVTEGMAVKPSTPEPAAPAGAPANSHGS